MSSVAPPQFSCPSRPAEQRRVGLARIHDELDAIPPTMITRTCLAWNSSIVATDTAWSSASKGFYQPRKYLKYVLCIMNHCIFMFHFNTQTMTRARSGSVAGVSYIMHQEAGDCSLKLFYWMPRLTLTHRQLSRLPPQSSHMNVRQDTECYW